MYVECNFTYFNGRWQLKLKYKMMQKNRNHAFKYNCNFGKQINYFCYFQSTLLFRVINYHAPISSVPLIHWYANHILESFLILEAW